MSTKTETYIIDAGLVSEEGTVAGTINVRIEVTTKQLWGHQGMAAEHVSEIKLLTLGVPDGAYTLHFLLLGKSHSEKVRVVAGTFVAR